jgi:phospholipase D1/2
VNSQEALFQPGRNCWRVTEARHLSLLVDCEAFYRAVHAAICNARRSIFIVGWEVHSRVRLLRGEDERNSEAPSVFVDLLAWKAKQSPNVQIYLLRWDSSVVFVAERELMTGFVWTSNTPENIHVCQDETAPLGGSHHQKVIIVDEELAFTGGMDIARERWDNRSHSLLNHERVDSSGPYDPYHDVQVMFDGPAVEPLLQLVKDRWKRAAKYPAITLLPGVCKDGQLVDSWPAIFLPTQKNMACAISRTIPESADVRAVNEVHEMYLDMISRAEKSIYIENQFLTAEDIALALNQQLKKQPKLKVTIVSSYNPKGLFERESMWAGRIEFKKILMKGISRARVQMVSPGIKDDEGKIHYKRIHSKIFCVDDKYLRVASSNLNHRSMGLDTECDVTFAASTPLQRRWIKDTRDDLIAEHTTYGYQFYNIDDRQFTDQHLQSLAHAIADPSEPGVRKIFSNPPRIKVMGALLLLLLLGVIIAVVNNNARWLEPTSIQSFLELSRVSKFALPIVCLVYILAGFLFFPVTMLSLITAAVFGSFWGPAYGMVGALLSAAIMFSVGRAAGVKWLRKFFGSRIRMVDEHFKNAGVVGVTAIRLLPLAPFSLVNLAAGISSVKFFDYIVGTFFGFLPGLFAKGLVADSMMQMFIQPTNKAKMYLAIGLVAWIAFTVASYYFAKNWYKKRSV